ncbi:MAG: chromosome segregation protein SMC [Fimbriimonas sp.]|nr:chromosome segregation protein SMC [Fimbriimonas sp.]
MRLKRVRLFGFKTFADRTEFNLDGGVIAVVGPNGCGKSNLVDAILWGLGEGNARNLRAQSNQDVIFSGTPRRKAVGYAEVSLFFDNEDGALPIDTPEVSISRRLTRSGDSEYAINRQNCRLRDIYDLLADSGLGRAGYAIVGQKEIDAALSASAEDRRGWIDEAAGVQRYRVRKIESQRRLAQALEHLTHVSGILTELEAQIGPLQQEAELAIRYNALSDALREVEIGLLIDEAIKAVREVTQLEKHVQDSTRKMREELGRAEVLDVEARRTAAKISEVEQEMDEIRSTQQSALTTLERALASLRVLEQRLVGLDDQEKALADDGKESETRLADTEAEVAALILEEEADRAALDELRKELSGVGTEAEGLRRGLDLIEKELSNARQAHAQWLKSEAELAHRTERRKQIHREIKGIDDSLPELSQGVSEAQDAYDDLASRSQKWLSKVKELETQMLAIRKEEEADAQAVRRSVTEKAALEGKQRGIEATIDTHEGINQGARAVLEAAERGILKAEYTPVGSAVEVEKDLALAIETALGASSNDLIVNDQQDAKTAIEWLKQHRAGRATFQPIPLMRPSEPSMELRRLVGQRGIVGRASELVQCSPRHRPVIDSLLGRVVIVEDIDVALQHAKTQGWGRLVTLDGEVVHSSGAVTGGQQARQGYGLVQRKADLAEITAEIKRLEKVIGEYDKRSAARSRAIQEADTQAASHRKNVASEQEEVTDARTFLQSLSDELKSTQKARERLTNELAHLDQVQAGAEQDVDIPSIERRRDEALKSLAAKSADAEQAEARLREAEFRLAQAQSRLYTGKNRLHRYQETEEHRIVRLQNLEPERKKIHAETTNMKERLAEAERAKTDAERRLEKLQHSKLELLEKSLQQSEEAKEARANATAISDAAHQAELNRARAESRRANALQRLYEEYELTEEDAFAQEGQHEVPKDAVTVVNRLRREIRSLGPVNVGAIETYQRITGRVEELSSQRDDCLSGITQVEATIAELDKHTKDRFVTTFSQVRVAFSEMFQKLFGGGEGNMALSDPEHVLESGIDLEITLPGKKRQPLALLSGGERAICASAFLFALLKVKPSPLVVLDEVDAPMDGSNVERFAKMLHEFTDSSQFIVITHNPTTIQSAPVWLGVSMQEPGISMLLPTKISGNTPQNIEPDNAA